MWTAIRIGLAGLLAASFAAGAPALKEKPAESVAGEWVVVTETSFRGPAGVDDMRWEFTSDGRWKMYRAGHFEWEGRYSADRTAAPPSLDLTPGGGPGDPNLCSYRIDGDALTVSYGTAGAARPTTFARPTDAGYVVYVLRRAKRE
jgi:uncharacterized protein (TIGR03067 family)